MTVSVTVRKKGSERWKAGHPWIYASDVGDVPKTLRGGEVVAVHGPGGAFLGQAFYSSASQIRLRWLTNERGPVDATFFRDRLGAAFALRQRAYPGLTSVRLVHGEADLLPGLVVDRFGDCLVVQFLTQGTEAIRELFIDELSKALHPSVIVDRSDGAVRRLEGLPPRKGLLQGRLDHALTYNEGTLRLSVDPLEGQKTGGFLDQRDNRIASARWGGARVLDCFSYNGGFALHLAANAKEVVAVDSSEAAVAAVMANAARNNLPQVRAVHANAFDFLRQAFDDGDRYDTVVLDPPAFARTKDSLESALRGYKELNLRAMQILSPGGTLITCSCSHHVDSQRFEEMLDAAAADAKRRYQIVARRGAGADHPVLVGLRETRYLKCYFLRALPR